MKSYYNYENSSRKVVVTIMAVIYMVIVAYVSKAGNQDAVPMFRGASLLGILTAVQFLIALLMVAIEFEVGGALAIAVTSISAIIALIPMLIMHIMAPLPGLLNNIACIIAIAIIRNRISTERKKSHIDDLTEIGNRKHMIQYTNHLIKHNNAFYLILLDLDHFKKLNDMLGHTNGDNLLKDLADKWSRIYSSTAVIGRLGGDEFLVVVRKRYCRDVEAFVQKYIDVVTEIAESPSSVCPGLTVSTGIVEYPAYGEDFDDLMRKADISVRHAQLAGRNMFMRYQDDFEKEVLREQYIESRIKSALDKELFYMVYQPQFETVTKKLRGFESLIRMNADGDEAIYPGEFIPVAEKTNLIIDIGNFVLKRVMSEFVDIVKEHKDLIVSVNVSAKQLLSNGFIDTLKNTIDSTGFNPQNLEIEITEYCLMDTAEEARELVKAIKAMGIKIAMDDFGTGYSSLSYLSKLTIDLLKIDKSLIDDMSATGEIVEAVCSMAHVLGCEVIAEGVEEELQLDVLREKNCNFIQGYIWSKPLSYEDAIAQIE